MRCPESPARRVLPEVRDAPGEPELLTLNAEVTLAPRDCITFDEFSTHMKHTGWKASDGTLVLWEARLVDPEQPFTT